MRGLNFLFQLSMSTPSIRTVRRWVTVLFLTTLIRVLVIPVPLAAFAAEKLLPQLSQEVRGTDGPQYPTPGIHLATIAGNALISPAMPVTKTSDVPLVRPTQRRITPRVKVPAGTTFRVTSTAYSSTVDQTDSSPFITANGTHVHDGTLAANFLPFGTRVIFPDYSGNKVYTVEDRTAKRYSDRADLWFPSRSAALQFGKRTLTMVVVE